VKRDRDFARIKARFRSFSDGEGTEELIGRYLQATESHLDGAEKALDGGNLKEAAAAAHRAAGACDIFGVAALAKLLRGLEERADQGDLPGSEEIFTRARGEFARIKSGLTRAGEGRFVWGR
jgi:HPt (histidine-containing phosphotransfer) domain-containing protein